MGMIRTSFFVLLSTLFIMNRQKAHLVLQLGSFAGMMLIPPFTEFAILRAGWQAALFFHLGLYVYYYSTTTFFFSRIITK